MNETMNTIIITNSLEYAIARLYLKDKYAKRSGLSYFKHIEDGISILEDLNFRGTVIDPVIIGKAFCLHPLFQADQDFKENIKLFYLDQIDKKVWPYILEYRNIANQYTSKHPKKVSIDIALSPLPEVNYMLYIDKIQNYIDYSNHISDKIPESERARLEYYFRSWFERLDIDFYRVKEYIKEYKQKELKK